MDTATPVFPYPLLEDAAELARYRGWSETVYRDLLAVRSGALSEADFYTRYYWQKAVLVLDMTGFTRTTMEHGELPALLRILDAHRVCLPVIRDGGADVIRSFADDLVALFDDPYQAARVAFEIHVRTREFANQNSGRGARCCIGIGFGKVLKIGPNLAQGDEMNRASKLGEDIADGGETLVTENVRSALAHKSDIEILDLVGDKTLFPYYRIQAARQD